MTGDYSGGRGSSAPVVKQWVINGWVELDYRKKLGPNTKDYSLVGPLYLFGASQAGNSPHSLSLRLTLTPSYYSAVSSALVGSCIRSLNEGVGIDWRTTSLGLGTGGLPNVHT